MSLELNCGTSPENLRIITIPNGTTIIGDYELSMEDFCEMVKYVLNNTDLLPDDLRLKLVEDIKNSKVVPGWNSILLQGKDSKRIQF